MSENVFCSECGQSCVMEAKFCHACGRQLQQPTAKLAAAPPWTREVYRKLRAKDALQAEQMVRDHLAQHPTDATAYALLGSTLFAQYKVDDAGEAFTQALKFPPDNFIVRMEYALFLGRMARYGDAAIEARRAVKKAANPADYERASELLRIVTHKSQGNFLHQSSLPSFAWLKNLFKS